MRHVWIGPAGWSYADWAGVVYPEPRGVGFHPLPFLARSVDIVEINSTFYRLASEAMARSWVRRIEAFPDFLFSVKIHQSFTHDRGGMADAAAFLRGIQPIIAARRLAALLLQFPWSFARSAANTAYLKTIFRLFEGQPLALEIRHSSWNDRSFFDFLRESRVAFCNIDQPVIGSSIGPTAVATRPDFAYVRLHGRNARNWFRPDAGRDARYDYLYSRDELGDWVRRIKDLAASSERVYVITNNHYRGQALANALQIKNMVSGEKLEIPAGLLKQYPLLEEIVLKIRAGQFDLFGEDAGNPSAPAGGATS
jgi:uncharacterized protein YecE (DUF72 family)